MRVFVQWRELRGSASLKLFLFYVLRLYIRGSASLVLFLFYILWLYVRGSASLTLISWWRK